jgi:50S ribosomal protein L16 3-hydroxylase
VVLARLLGDFPAQRFLEEFYHRLPFSRPGGATGIAPEIGWDRVRALVESTGADLLLSRRGQLTSEASAPSFDTVRRLYAEGFTITVRSAERHDPDLARLAGEFHADFLAPVNIHLYCTPSGGHGFGWHYDVEDVFVLQTEGAKVYSLRKNTVNPWPVLETMPRDLHFEREGSPVITCRLEAGDVLYIPAGWWHIAKTEAESKSLAVGLMSPTALDLVRCLEPELAKSVIWRQRLPVSGGADPAGPEERLERLSKVVHDLGRDLGLALNDPNFVRRFLESRLADMSRKSHE